MWAAGGQPTGPPPSQLFLEQVPRLCLSPSHGRWQGLHLLQALVIGFLVFLVRLDHYHAGGALRASGCTQVLQRREKGCLDQRPHNLCTKESRTDDPPA